MKKLYIHAGFGKCGSSSIQAFLSSSAQFKCENGDDLIYAALLNKQRVVYGKELTKLAYHSHSGARVSVPFPLMKPSPDAYFDVAGEQILALLQKNHVVLSQEGWSNKPDDWNKISFFRKNNIDVTFIFYVRPPVNWMNSAWWQWGAWHTDNFDAWITQSINGVKYNEIISSFNKLDWIKQIRVRLLDNDLLDDLAHTLELDQQSYQQDKSVFNKSLPNGMLRLFQQHRRLRPGPHDGAIDFTLEKYLKLDGKADWVLDAAHIKKIIDETRDSNMLLLNFIDEDCKEKFLADQRYWDPAAFDGIQAKPAAGIKPTYKELEDIALAGIDAVMNLAAQQQTTVNASPAFDNFMIWKDLALHVENSDTKLAYRLMQEADKLRPKSPYIQNKLAGYEKKLTRKKSPLAK